MKFKEELQKRQNYINEVLDKYLPNATGKQETVLEAMRYSVLIGGKRIRAIILLELFRSFSKGEEEEKIEPFLAAIELLHAYSLVHDDLPDMDNDTYRRGQLTTHAKYGSAMAILTGDALLNYSMETISSAFSMEDMAWNEKVIKAMQIFTKKAGIYGMIGGQVVDVEKTGQALTKEDISFIYDLKTCALLEAAALMGAVLGGAEEEAYEAVKEMAFQIGMAFQIQDDILDLTGNEAKLGKPIHSDEKNQKTTYVSLYGIEQAKEAVSKLSEEAGRQADKLGCTEFFKELINYLITRDY